MLSVLTAAFVGAISGLHASLWGSYKDSPYEKFYFNKFLRSIFISIFFGVFLMFFFSFNKIDTINLGVFFAVVLCFERLATESYKLFIRTENQKKYFIPSQLHFRGKLVKSLLVRVIVGICVWILIFSIFYSVGYISTSIAIDSNILKGMLFGLLGGLGAAVSGAIKDAPVEGFDLKKFLRSPSIGIFWGLAFSFITQQWVLITFATGGTDRMTLELYKGFIKGLKSGKFKMNKPTYPGWCKKRNILIIPYIMTWIVFLFLLLNP
jgi:hypothetical protein